MKVDILDHWQDLIEAAESLGVGGNPLFVDFDDSEVFESGVMAMVIYKSRLSLTGKGYTFALVTHELMLEIHKICAETAIHKR